jgi:hypothetical protein
MDTPPKKQNQKGKSPLQYIIIEADKMMIQTIRSTMSYLFILKNSVIFYRLG